MIGPETSSRKGDAGGRDDWDRHWRAYAEAAARNPAQEYRRRLIVALLGGVPRPERILDIGAGTGDLAVALRTAFPEASVFGIDVSEAGIEIARSKVPEVEFVRHDLLESEADPVHRGWATHAVCSEVLEHVDDPVRLLRNAASYLAPSARLVVSVPGGPMSRFDRHVGHRKHYTPGQLQGLLEQSGFEVELATGAGYPFFNVYKLVVILRGGRLVRDVEEAPSLLARWMMAFFRILFRLNSSSSRWGWQTVAKARLS